MKLKFEVILDVDTNKFSCNAKKIHTEEEATKGININSIADQINQMFDYLAREYPKKFIKDNKVISKKDKEKLN